MRDELSSLYQGFDIRLIVKDWKNSHVAAAIHFFAIALRPKAARWNARNRPVMSLLQSAKLNGHEPWAYLKDVLTGLPTQLNSRIEELLPHRWQQAD